MPYRAVPADGAAHRPASRASSNAHSVSSAASASSFGSTASSSVSSSSSSSSAGVIHVETPPPAPRLLASLDLVLLTVCLAGVQFAWTVELAYGSPYLLALGLPKSLTSLVWLAGPLSGLLIQPVVGAYSDRCTLRLGKRRPFILVGSVLVLLAILVIGFAHDFATAVMGASVNPPLGSEKEAYLAEKIQNLTIALVVVAFYMLDFAINAVQASCRALILDAAPVEQQDAANAWAGRMLGFGNVFGYLLGFANLPLLFPALGDTQIKVLCVLACIFYGVTVLATCVAVNETPGGLQAVPTREDASSAHRPLFPRRHEAGWLRPLSDIVTTIAQLPRDVKVLCYVQFFSWMGWFPFLFYSTAWVGALFKAGHDASTRPALDIEEGATRAGSLGLLLFSLVSVATGVLAPLVAVRPGEDRAEMSAFRRRAARFLAVRAMWTASIVLYAGVMVSTPFVGGVVAAAAVVSAAGIPWGVSMWAPFSLIGEYMGAAENARELTAGTVLGIHNVFIVLPQFVITFVASVVFSVVGNGAGGEGQGQARSDAGAFAAVFLIGGASALVGAGVSTRLRDSAQKPDEYLE